MMVTRYRASRKRDVGLVVAGIGVAITLYCVFEFVTMVLVLDYKVNAIISFLQQTVAK